ncbi:flagellar basal body P-ring protein FlgI [Escherichia coli]
MGLDDTGDQTTRRRLPHNVRTCSHSWELPFRRYQMQLKNVAAVMVRASLPPFGRQGQTISCGGFFHGKCQKLAWRYVVDDAA